MSSSVSRRLHAIIALALLSACSPKPPEPAFVFAEVRNPVFGLQDAAVKDAYAVRHDGVWHLGFSRIRDNPFRFQLGFATTRDWKSFDEGEVLDQEDTGGLASPDVVQEPGGGFVMTYNSHTRDVGTASSKLYFRRSADLVRWSEPTRIHIEGADAPEDRLIDAALALTEHGAFLFFKREQLATVAYSESGSIDGPWKLLGTMEPSNLENVQALKIDGAWHLLGTTIPLVHRPVLHRLGGDPATPSSWLEWNVVRELRVAEQSWNTGPNEASYERSNAGYLIDNRSEDDGWYLLYAGSTELSTFEGRGHSSLGLARSADLGRFEAASERQ